MKKNPDLKRSQDFLFDYKSNYSSAACAAASLAIGTRNGEQLA